MILIIIAQVCGNMFIEDSSDTFCLPPGLPIICNLIDQEWATDLRIPMKTESHLSIPYTLEKISTYPKA